MHGSGLDDFITDWSAVAAKNGDPADCVIATAPLMERLLEGDCSFLRPEHLRSDPARYPRNAIYISPGEQRLLFSPAWLPGQMEARARSWQLGRGWRPTRHPRGAGLHGRLVGGSRPTTESACNVVASFW
jgi:hypothetical protein